MKKRVNKPWGYEIIWAHNEFYAGKILYINAGHSLSLQYHEKKTEDILVFSGKIKFTHQEVAYGDLVEQELGPGQAFSIPVGKVHQMAAIEDSVVFEVSTPELDDVVRIEDKYGRVDPLTSITRISEMFNLYEGEFPNE